MKTGSRVQASMHRVKRSAQMLLLAGAALLAIALVDSSASQAQLPIESFDGSTVNSDGTTATQAGSHPDSTTSFMFPYRFNSTGILGPVEDPKNVTVDLPPGLVGNPTAVPTCSARDIELGPTSCPNTSQVGVVAVQTQLFSAAGETPSPLTVPLYNLSPPAGVPAEFAFNLSGVVNRLDARVRTGGDYGVSIDAKNISETTGVIGVEVTFWGVPADPIHDESRGACLGNSEGTLCPTAAPIKPFLSLPTECASGPSLTTLTVDSWQDPTHQSTASFRSHDASGSPVGLTGCDRLDFRPAIALVPDTTQADAPSGDRAVDLTIPQNENPTGLATAHLREAVVAAPLGVTLNPGAAAGLQACSDEQIALRSATPATCPDASVIGTAKVTTPLLDVPLEGQVFVGAPECAPCGEADAREGRLLRLFVQVQGDGVVIKAAGVATPNPVTGQVTVTFKELPQQPFSDLLLTFRGGDRAVFINPLACGRATLNTSLTPWSGMPPASPAASFNVDWDGAGGACPETLPFSPTFSAGTVVPQAADFSSFTTTFSRPDRNQVLNAIGLRLPPGLLGSLAGVPQCGEPQAAQGTCSAASRIATANVAAGTGPHPYWFSGPVYLTGPYKGAPFGLSVAVPAVAGPFNLGTVVTRAAINVDPNTAQVTVTSDPLPQIIDGIKTHIQTVNVTVDRPDFTFNPTNCTAASVSAKVASTEGTTASLASSFQVANCANLSFKPKLSAAAGGKASKASGASLDVKVLSKGGPQPGGGEANIRLVKVSLPKQLPSRLTTLQKACVDSVFEANPASCPTASNVGSATVTTPVLAHPLSGPAYLVSHGGAAFPDLEIVLQGEGVTLVLDGKTDIKKGITTSTFDSVPDAPISSFELKLPTGKYSVLTANLPASAKYNLCGKALTMPTTITGQNGAVLNQTTKIAISGCSKAKKKAIKKKAKKPARARRAKLGERGKA
jgi:hypothetical protein